MDDFQKFTGKSETPSGRRGESDDVKTARALMDEAKAEADKYHGKSEGDMMREIYARALEGKRNGTLTNEQIDAFYRQFASVLDGAKRKKLQRIVEQLKKM